MPPVEIKAAIAGLYTARRCDSETASESATIPAERNPRQRSM